MPLVADGGAISKPGLLVGLPVARCGSVNYNLSVKSRNLKRITRIPHETCATDDDGKQPRYSLVSSKFKGPRSRTKAKV